MKNFSEVDELSAYAWVSYACGAIEMREVKLSDIFAVVSTFRDAPLLAFKEATCRGVNADGLAAVTAADPRFIETAYLLGLREVGRRKLDEAEIQFERAYAWRPRWPALTLSMANVAMTGEEFEKAERLYRETLAADPRAADALLGDVKALTYLGRAEDAIAAVDRLLGERWHLGDARYWRALNENQLGQLDAAWDDIEAAAKLLINAEVPKLAGIIAYRRQQLDVSRAKFEESRQRDRNDCETGFYLGIVLSDQHVWMRAADVLRETVSCSEAAEQEAIRDIATIRASTDPPERRHVRLRVGKKSPTPRDRHVPATWRSKYTPVARGRSAAVRGESGCRRSVRRAGEGDPDPLGKETGRTTVQLLYTREDVSVGRKPHHGPVLDVANPPRRNVAIIAHVDHGGDHPVDALPAPERRVSRYRARG